MNSITYKNVLVDGVNIFYIEAGDPDYPSIVLLHGFPSSSFMFRNLIDNLKEKYHLIAPTYPGFGLSGMPSAKEFNYSFDHLAEVMERFIDTLAIEKASFLMHDYGGPVGFRIIEKRPELLEKMIVMNANAYIEGLTESSRPLFDYWKNPTVKNKANLEQLLTLEGTKFQYYNGVTDSLLIDPAIVYTDQYFLDRKGNKEIQLTLLYDYQNNVPKYPKWQMLFRKIQPETLIIWGENDTFFSKKGALKYKDDLKNVEYVFYPTGHFPLEEFHHEIGKRIDDFLRKKILE
ncbi:alpha/beta fold hydrolase [Sphingobacterium faecale]|uniref:Alpha/beta hydrolase n=1 Tax=Sphingobacterium faecale TaxID=2803775 RepID=A0ABS1R6R8_9SPHI|nr:alpha/beta hydrolase [Sphingobacterium faecale]MBL1409929.1 alpha/beta hydrolase [Sphingobacterium faecale]